MIKDYLHIITKDLIRYSQSLAKSSILIEKPWTLIDEDNEVQKLIFKKNKELILSKNGQVNIGKWDYFPDAKCLLIDRGTDKILCNEAYIDNAVMILKLDGSNNKYFSFANEILIPNLDIIKYLEDVRNFKLYIKVYDIIDEGKLEIQQQTVGNGWLYKGNKVTISGSENNVKNGIYKLIGTDRQIEVVNSIIEKVYFEIIYKLNNNTELLFIQSSSYEFYIGELVYNNLTHKALEDDIYVLNKNLKIEIIDGKISKIFKRNSLFGFPIGKYYQKKYGTADYLVKYNYS